MVSDSSKKWLMRQKNDRFVKMAKDEGVRSRAVFKLRAIQEKTNVILPGMMILELGAAPGSWTEELSEWVGSQGSVIAVDSLEMRAIEDTEVVQFDISTPEFQVWQKKRFELIKPDIVVSDIAVNTTGDKRTDQLRQEAIGECICDIAEDVLREDGSLLMKTFHGTGFEPLLKRLRLAYKQVKVMKPEASQRSKHEVYLLASGYNISL